MQCLACRADNKMLLIDVVADDTTKEPVIERKTYMCSECRHIARRLVFKRVKMPITHLPVIPIPIDKLWNGRVAAPRTWAKAVEKLRNRQIDLKERTAAAKIAGWTTAVEKVRSKQAGLAEQGRWLSVFRNVFRNCRHVFLPSLVGTHQCPTRVQSARLRSDNRRSARGAEGGV